MLVLLIQSLQVWEGQMNEVIFLKVGGSLITDKSTANTPRLKIIDRIALEIAEFHEKNPDTQLLLGHGSGSYGHSAAKKHNTFRGVNTKEEWRGFFEVWYRARELNTLITDALHKAGLPIVSFSMCTSAIVSNHQIKDIELDPISLVIKNGGIPLVYGDVVFDQVLGGTILSTEDIFFHLAKHFSPSNVLLAGVECGVFSDYPKNEQLIHLINNENYSEIKNKIKGSVDPDVTGGMSSKVEKMLSLTNALPSTSIQIFSGSMPGVIKDALNNEHVGTKISKIYVS